MSIVELFVICGCALGIIILIGIAIYQRCHYKHTIVDMSDSIRIMQGIIDKLRDGYSRKDIQLGIANTYSRMLEHQKEKLDEFFHDSEAMGQVIRYQDARLNDIKQDNLRRTRQIAIYAENYYGAMARLQHHNDLATEKNKNYLAISNKWTDVKERIELLLR